MNDTTDFHFYRDDDGELKQINLTTGEETFAALPTARSTFKYSLAVAQQIVQHVREGMPITRIAKLAGFPEASVIYSWQRSHPDFGSALTAAREDRAEYYHDKVIEEVEQLSEKDDVPVVKERVSAYKWAAEKGNPERYGKAKGEGGSGTVTIIVDTGVPQPIVVEGTCTNIQTEDVITIPSETCSLKDSDVMKEDEMTQGSGLESVEEQSTIG